MATVRVAGNTRVHRVVRFGSFDGGIMDECVLGAVVGLNEAKSLYGVEEFGGATNLGRSPLFPGARSQWSTDIPSRLQHALRLERSQDQSGPEIRTISQSMTLENV